MKSYRERTEDILEKAKTVKKARASRNKKLAAGISCSLAAVLVLNLALFLPGGMSADPMSSLMPEIGGTAESYLEIQERLSSMRSEPSWDDEYWTDSPGSEGNLPGSEGTSTVNEYREIGRAQAEGAEEGDILQIGNGTAFYLTADFHLQAYSLSSASLIGEIAIAPEGGYFFMGDDREMYLCDDLSSAVLFATVCDPATWLPYTAVIEVETKNPATMSVTGMQFISGKHSASRLIGDIFLTVSRFTVPQNSDLTRAEDYLPHTGVFGKLAPIPASAIFLPDEAHTPVYTVVTTLSKTGKLLATRALLSFAGEASFSKSAVYATNNYLASTQEEGRYEYRTNVVRIAYDGEGNLALSAKATVGGMIGGSASMDEWEGNLRIFATTKMYENNDRAHLVLKEMNASLYILDARTLELLASKEAFAPAGEGVRIVRFDGKKGYAGTSEDLSSPVFAFGLSPDDLTCTRDENTPTLSLYLTKFSGGLLLGIGKATASVGVKVELYHAPATLAASYRAKELMGNAESCRAYYIDREQALIGFAAIGSADSAKCYLLLGCSGGDISEIARIPISCSAKNARAFVENGTLYLFDGTLTARFVG